MSGLLRLLLLLWRSTLGLLFSSCRFTPSCSHYAVEALQRRGPVIGPWLALRRVARCNPLCAGGHDPVLKSSPPCRGRRRA